jgi:uncharacterized membrane protein YkoI
MKKRIFALLTVLCLCLGLLAACGSNDPISQDKAVKIALKDAGYSESQVSDIHVHIIEENGTPCYNVHFTVDGASLSYNIAVNGDILSAGEGGH